MDNACLKERLPDDLNDAVEALSSLWCHPPKRSIDRASQRDRPTTNTMAQQDRGTLYDTNGNVIGSLDVWGVTHLTWRDLNGNGQPDTGEITANTNTFKFSCP